MADPNSTTGLKFHQKFGPGEPLFSWNIGPLDQIFQDQNSPDSSHSSFRFRSACTYEQLIVEHGLLMCQKFKSQLICLPSRIDNFTLPRSSKVF